MFFILTKEIQWTLCVVAAVSMLIAVALMADVGAGTDLQEGYFGGYRPDNIFAYHHLFMTMAIMFGVFAHVSYIVLPFEQQTKKYCHVAFHICAIAFATAGVTAVVKAAEGQNIYKKYFTNMTSMHSWIGLCSILLYLQNFIIGALAFLFRVFAGADIKKYLPTHVSMGIISLCFSMCAVQSGISLLPLCSRNFSQQMTLEMVAVLEDYEDYPPGCRIIQGAGMVVVAACICAFFAIIPAKQYPNKPETPPVDKIPFSEEKRASEIDMPTYSPNHPNSSKAANTK